MPGVLTVWGIDVGRCALKAVKLKLTGEDAVELVAHDYVEHAKILSQPDADRDELITNSIEKFLSRNDISNDQIVVAVPGQQTLARFTKLPPVDKRKVPDIVRYEADQQIPFDMDEVIWDYQTFQQEDLPDIEVGIFAMKRELIRGHLLHFEQAGIEPMIVQSGPLAVYNAAMREKMIGEETTILLDIGAEATDVIIATRHGLWTRTIHIGGNRFTEALVKSFKLSFSKAENLKRTAASSRYARQIFQAMRPIFADLVQELQRSIGFYSSTHRDARIDKVIGLGNAFKLPGLQKYLQQNLGYVVEQPSTYKSVSGSAAAAAPQFSENVLSFAVAYGLSLQGLGQATITSNLLPTEIAKQVVWRKKRPFMAAAAACFLLAGVSVWLRYSWDISALAAQEQVGRPKDADEAWRIIDSGPAGGSPRAAAKRVELAANTLKSEYNDLKNKGQAELEGADYLIELQKRKAAILRIFDAIHRVLPRDDDPYSNAEDGVAAKEAFDRGQAPPRQRRREINIERIEVVYRSNIFLQQLLNPLETRPNVEFGEDEEIPGFFIRIWCTSAHEDRGDFIEREFLSRLRKEVGLQPGAGFIFNRVFLGDRQPVRASRAASRVEATTPAPGQKNVLAPRPHPGNADLLTGESLDEEWRYDIQMDAVLIDFKEFDQPEGEDTGEEDGG
ncbi:MAG: type IV pilus assembly protein PilM [Phycisphaerales bacterium]|nr:MAG: type IV pilus assembly protein PilM [Phycisphaerales bacterium]